MSDKRKMSGIVYSTNPDFVFDTGQQAQQSLPAGEQRLTVKTDAKHRKGKIVTLVDGFTGKAEDLDALAKRLKTACGSGGSAKDGQVIIQGDHQQKIRELLKNWGYGLKR